MTARKEEEEELNARRILYFPVSHLFARTQQQG
jgi:hypothetical protein